MSDVLQKLEQKEYEAILAEIKKVESNSLKKKLLAVNELEGKREIAETEGYLKEFTELQIAYDLKFNKYYEEVRKYKIKKFKSKKY